MLPMRQRTLLQAAASAAGAQDQCPHDGIIVVSRFFGSPPQVAVLSPH